MHRVNSYPYVICVCVCVRKIYMKGDCSQNSFLRLSFTRMLQRTQTWNKSRIDEHFKLLSD